MSHVRRFALLGAATVFAVAGAHAQEKVLREGQVTQEALIDALAPAGAASAAEGGDAPGLRTRSFRPAARPAGAVAGTAAASARPARASILVTFVTNSTDLTAGAKSALDVLAAAMKSEKLARVNFIIEGHADPRGGDELNMKLSQARADSVRAYLTATHGLPAERVKAVGKGSSALMNPGDPAAPENRRVTIVAQPG
ncbi:MAG: OmpA family protein [Leptothrix sp. (in: Bacteria)]|nr:OmpA family protein [Leptothrix sp. (in: b-proteobacteria)]